MLGLEQAMMMQNVDVSSVHKVIYNYPGILSKMSQNRYDSGHVFTQSNTHSYTDQEVSAADIVWQEHILSRMPVEEDHCRRRAILVPKLSDSVFIDFTHLAERDEAVVSKILVGALVLGREDSGTAELVTV